MIFLAPAFLFAAAAVAAGVVALHFIVSREPKAVPLPTARFAPERPARAQPRALSPEDLLLLLVRILALLFVGAALARPVVAPPRRPVAHVVVVDRSRAVASGAEVTAAAGPFLGAGDALVLFDSSATVAGGDSLEGLTPSPGRGRLSTGLVAALRAASALRDAADSFELVLVSPFAVEEMDDATDSIRALWPGTIRLVPVAARENAPLPGIQFDGPAGDPLRWALPPARPGVPATVRIVRGSLDAESSAWARGGARVLVHWPERPGPPADTVGAVIAGDAVVVAPFPRTIMPDSSGRVVARWVDGTPAAVETAIGPGCIRSVAIAVPSRGDLVLEPRFARLVAALTEPCGGATGFAAIDARRMAALAGLASAGRAPRAAIAQAETIPSPLAPWLFGIALVVLGVEMAVRRK